MEIREEFNTDARNDLAASFRLTRRCNNNCFHCCINLPIASSVSELSAKEWEKIIDQLVENNYQYLYLTGGEITVYKDFEEVYTYAKKKGMLVGLLTNATCFNEKIKNLFAKYPPYKVIVTIYGVNKETYTTVTGNPNGWEEFSKNIDFLSYLQKEKGTILELTSIITKDTIKFYKEIDNFSIKYTGKPADFSKALFSRLDKDTERNKLIESKKVDKNTLKSVAANFSGSGDFQINVDKDNVNKTYDGLFPCQVGRKDYINFFEDGTMTLCNLLIDDKYCLRLTKDEIDKFNFKQSITLLKEKMSPLYTKKINEKCGNCTLRRYCLSCPAKNLINGIPIDDYDIDTCIKEL